MTNLIFIIFIGTFIFMAALVASILFKNVRDENFIVVLFVAEFLFFPSTGTQLEIKHLIIPLIASIILLRRVNLGALSQMKMKYSIPFFIYFGMGLYWFLRTGMVPNVLTGNTDSASGNFIIYYNVFCNACLFIIGMNAQIRLRYWVKIFGIFAVVLGIQVFAMSCHNFGVLPHLPFIMPAGSDHIIESAFSDFRRDGVLSQYLYFETLLLILVRRRLRLPLTILMFIINVIIGGGRTEVASILLVLLLVEMFEGKSTLRVGVSLFGSSLLLLVSLGLGIGFMTDGQKSRFLEMGDVGNSAEMTSETSGRMAMWKYSIDGFIESPIIGNGIGKLNSESSYSSVAQRNVNLGSSHQFYLSVLYVFGLSGFIPIVLGLIIAGVKLMRCLRSDESGVVAVFLITLLTHAFVLFMVNGGVKKLFFLFFLFLGAVPQLLRSLRLNESE